jgi:hypothetical protein
MQPLQQDAAARDDENRRCFLTTVPIHRDLVTTYREWRVQDERVEQPLPVHCKRVA